MSYEVIATEPFARKLKKLAKKHKSLKEDLTLLIDTLSENPEQGVPLGGHCYKIRLSITSKGKGKSWGGRVITYVKVISERVYLMDIYDKSDQATISQKELKLLIALLSEGWGLSLFQSKTEGRAYANGAAYVNGLVVGFYYVFYNG